MGRAPSLGWPSPRPTRPDSPRADRGMRVRLVAQYSRLMTDTTHLNDVVIVHELITNEVYEFSTYVEQPDGSLLIGDNLEAQATFLRVDGELLSASLTPYGTVERLIPTGDRDLAKLRT